MLAIFGGGIRSALKNTSSNVAGRLIHWLILIWIKSSVLFMVFFKMPYMNTIDRVASNKTPGYILAIFG